MQNPHIGGLCGGQGMEFGDAIPPATAKPLNTADERTLSRLEFQLRKIRRLHQQARESGIQLNPANCTRELDDAVKWATRGRP